MPRRSTTPPPEAAAPRSSRRQAPETPVAPEPQRFRINLSRHRQREILALLLFALGGLTLLSLFGVAGAITSLWATLLTRFAGWGAYVLALALMVAGVALLRRQENVFGEFEIPWGRIVGLEILFAAGCGLLSLALAADDRQALQLAENGQAGGYLGLALASLLSRAFANIVDASIANILAAAVLVVAMIAVQKSSG